MRGFVAYAFALLKQAQGSKQRKEQYILSVLKREKTMNREILFRGKQIDNGEWDELCDALFEAVKQVLGG